MRVNITVAFDVVEEIDAGEHSVDLADLDDSGMGPNETAGAIVATIEDAARKARGAGKQRPAPDPDAPSDYPLDPDQD
jgi:hypothetical protein